MVTISTCLDKKAMREFEQVPERIHKQDPCFVPPFPGSISKIFSKTGAFQRHGSLFPFIATRDGKSVGRIAAIVNRTHNAYNKDQVGFFGFFDSIDDQEVADALFTAASSKLREFGLTSMRGPYSPSIHDEFGVLVDGFDSTPFVMMPYNPSYYLGLYDRAGLQKARDFYAYYMSASTDAPERVMKIVDRVKRTTGIKIRHINMKNLDEELRVILKLYNETLERNWGFSPITYEDLQFAAEDLKAIAVPEMVLIAEKNGEAVGYSLTLPNINELLWRARKGGRLWRVLKFVWFMKTKHPKEARLTALGVAPEFRRTGIAALFYVESLLRGRQRYIGGELSWVDEDNKEIISNISVMGAKRYKTYRIFEQSLSH